jgi:hypothetical protein
MMAKVKFDFSTLKKRKKDFDTKKTKSFFPSSRGIKANPNRMFSENRSNFQI